MLDLKSYITEGIFDEDDIMNDIDNNAEITKWFKKLTDSDNIIKNRYRTSCFVLNILYCVIGGMSNV